VADTDPEKESERLFGALFPGYDEYATELLTHSDPQLKEILGALIGWKFKNLDPFPSHRGHRSVSPDDVAARMTIPRDAAIKVAQQFENEGKGLNREGDIGEFYKLFDAALGDTAHKKFTKSQNHQPVRGKRVKKGQAMKPGTPQHTQLSDLFSIAGLNTDK
tara:strand:- start:73 stop:558 length:486 start_codon:yes stop_codon:yes gene_type:complete